MSEGLWDLTRAARRLRLPRRSALRELHSLQDRHGGLLFRAEGGRTKLWVNPARLLEVRPDLRERAGDTTTRLDELERQVADLEAFRAKASEWFRRAKVRQK